MCTRSAGRHNREVRPLKTILDGQITRYHIDDIAGHKEGGNPARPTLKKRVVARLNTRDATDTRSNGNANPFGIGLGHFDAGVFESLATGRHSVMDEDIHFLGILVADVIRNIEIPHTSTDPCGEFGNIENI